jgi:acyl carrier protein
MSPDSNPTRERLSKEQIFETVATILTDMTSDWDIDFEGGIKPETQVISDLQLESIDVVQIIAQLESKFQRKDLPFENFLMVDERYRDDFTVQELVDFLHNNL